MIYSDAICGRPALFLCLAGLFVALTPTASAQFPDVGGSWLDIDINTTAGLPTRIDATDGGLFFFTALDGIRGLHSDDDTTLVTSDGGETWLPVAGRPIMPDGALADGFAWRRNGRTTSDLGRTWQQSPGANFADYVAGTRAARAGIGALPGFSTQRLLHSVDSGATWTPLDELGPGPFADSVITRSRFGALPAPATMLNPRLEWQRLISYNGDVIVAISSAIGTIDAALSTRYYLTTLDISARTISSIELPMWRDRSYSQIIRPRPTVAVLSPSRILIGDHEWDTYFFESRFIRMWLSEDGGATWAPNDTIPWIHEPSLRFFSPTFGVSTSGRTTDGGRTWQRHGRPFGAVFFALDSMRWFVADARMLTGRTTDGGITWSRSRSSAPLRAIVAHRGNVAIARSQRSVVVSSDGGTTWTDVGRSGGLPDNLAHIVAMNWVDTADAPGHLVGIGAFVDERNVRSARIVASTDYGRTWVERSPIRFLDYAVFTNDVIQIPLVILPTPGGEGAPGALFVGGPFGLAASEDNGATWQLRSSEIPIHGLAMIGASSGVAISGDWDNSAISFYSTGDGGRTWRLTHTTSEGFVYPVGLTLTDLGYRAIVSNYSAGHREWIVLSSYDGESWSQRRGSHDGPPVKGGDAFWSDRDRVHIVGRGASILYGSNGGANLAVHHDAIRRFIHALSVDSTADAIYRPLFSARDGRDIYVADYFRNVGKWTMADDVLSAPIVTGSSNGIDAQLLVSHDRSSATLHATSRSMPDAWLIDMRGARVRLDIVADGAGRFGARIDFDNLMSGAYLVRVGSDEGSLTLPFVVAR